MADALKIREIYNRRAKRYDKILSKLRYHATIGEILRSMSLNTNDGSKILDLGCGTGLATGVLKERFPKSEIIGFDYCEEMLNIYKKRFSEIETVIGDFNKGLNYFDSESFDLIVSTGAVSEYGDREKVIPFVYEILKNGGAFVNVGIKKNVMSLITRKVWHYKPMGKKDFISACNKAGFSDIEKIKISWDCFPTNITKFVIKARK